MIFINKINVNLEIDMTEQTTQLTNLDPRIVEFQDHIRAKYQSENQNVKKGQIVFVGSSLMEIFPIEKMQQEQALGLKKIIYNRGVRATTTADLLAHLDTLIFDLEPSKIFLNIGSNDIGFNVPENVYLANYAKILTAIQTRLPQTEVFLMAYYPINTVDDFGEERKEHQKFYEHRSNALLEHANAQVKILAQQFDYQYINVNAGLTDATGNLKKAFTFDGAHMLPVGYQVVLENMRKYLD
jgi:lysophospholipase L1-like esterase